LGVVDPDADLNRVHTEQWASFVVGSLAWGVALLLGAKGTASAIIATAVYLGTYFGVRAWRLRRKPGR
jgi:hypothetical protein